MTFDAIALGAYGITINNGNGATQNAYLVIKDNEISTLSGEWVHAIGLEANTPNVEVSGNSISDITSPGPDKVAVWFESSNPSFSTARVNGNNFNFTEDSGVYGIAVQFASGAPLDGTCNWWGSKTGPSGEGVGLGALVSPLVTFSPWLKGPAPDGTCTPVAPKGPKGPRGGN